MALLDSLPARAILRRFRNAFSTAALLAGLLTLAPTSSAQAVSAELSGGSYRLFETVDLAANIGTFGALQTEQVFELGLEARLTPFELLDVLTLRPIVGASLLDDGGNYWYIGARAEFEIAPRYSLGLSFAPGIYSAGGVDLGGPVEFRSGIDVSHELLDGLAVGVGLFHLSNGGLYSRNQGSESILFSLATEL